MTEPTQQDRFETVLNLVLNALFDEYESLSIQNKANQTAMANECDPTMRGILRERIAKEIQTLRQLPKYSDLRRAAIESVRLRDPDAFAGLIPQVKARFVVWSGLQKTQ